MRQKNKAGKAVVLWVLIGLVLLAIVLVLCVGIPYARAGSAAGSVPPAPERSEPTPRVKTVERIVEVEREVTAEVIRDGLNDMGLLTTEEYYFTELVSFSSIKTLFRLELPITKSAFLASYDGVIAAGIDFSKITVEKDEAAREIVVRIPLPEILSVDIDPESFALYSEKEGLGNPISITDYNNALIELESSAAQKAIDRGVLERAAENAQALIKTFILSLVDAGDYTLRFLPAAA
ncbi:MAG: DUF4230 domain-containing protein [Oscillospiraceae bacterium]|nr:DUF4230 domain-containing protein [Oscillospiraceae bacterium]